LVGGVLQGISLTVLEKTSSIWKHKLASVLPCLSKK
jgi:hypothetical protein